MPPRGVHRVTTPLQLPSRCALALLLAFVPAAGAEPELLPLAVATAAGGRAEFQVEVADSQAERALGLMHRRELDAGRGMLLWYAQPVEVRIWMKNTHVPLDIIFIDQQDRVTGIAYGEPLSERLIPSSGPIRAVLELNAGQAALHGIAPGARVEFPPRLSGQ